MIRRDFNRINNQQRGEEMNYKTGVALLTAVFMTSAVFSVPPGRFAFINDGNNRDSDDIAAIPVQVALMSIFNVEDRLVHATYACDSRNGSEEAKREKMLKESLEGAAELWGNYDKSTFFNYHTQKNASIAHLTEQINASTAASPLWIIEAGEPDMIYLAVKAAQQNKRQYIRIVTHHPNNDKGVQYNLTDILALDGMARNAEVRIHEQNGNLKKPFSQYSWARDHADPRVKFLWDRAQATQSTNYAPIKGDFDPSDAGMVWYVLTGGPEGNGDQDCTPKKLESAINKWLAGNTTSVWAESGSDRIHFTNVSVSSPVSIYTTAGRLIKSGLAGDVRTQGLEKGMYLIRYRESSNGNVFVRKLTVF